MKEFVLALYIFAVFGLIFVGPFALIWSLNTLFPVLNIGYTLKTWAAAFVFLLMLAPYKVSHRK
jgi:hypothetical protein